MLGNRESTELLRAQTVDEAANSRAIRLCQERLATALEKLERLVPPESVTRVTEMRGEVETFNVRVSMVGQVKAGKTALTNAMIGRPNLLPSDVNPWTSVITSVHMNTPQPLGKNAVFSFFTTQQWDQMVDAGGHLGEMARRANYDDEVTELRTQVELMQRRTKARLGRNFNLLLDGYHSFLGFTPEMIKKYVCLGEEDDAADGRYADITKSADIYIENDDYVLPTVMCDTPGVNDPFLLREAVTLENLSDTDICVVVLSAHQAFSTVDIGLLRILMALKHEQLVLFVNRIDELPNPDAQIQEIDGYIRELLTSQNLPADLPIVFGSAAWAEVASSGETGMIDARNGELLSEFAANRANRLEQDPAFDGAAAQFGTTQNSLTKMSDLSGMHELQSIIQEKSALGIAQPRTKLLRDRALDLAQQSLLYLEEASNSTSTLRTDLQFDDFFDSLDTILQDADEACLQISKELSDKVLFMVSGAFRKFIVTEKAGLKAHIASKAKLSEWSADTDALRFDLNQAHDGFVRDAPQQVNEVFESTAARIEAIYRTVLDDNASLFVVRPPVSLGPSTPVSLMRTMAIDMQTGWFSKWFAATLNKESFIKKFETISQAELKETMADMREVYIVDYMKQLRGQLHDFLAEHINTLQNLSMLDGQGKRADALRKLGIDTEVRQRIVDLEDVVHDLETLFRKPKAAAPKPEPVMA